MTERGTIGTKERSTGYSVGDSAAERVASGALRLILSGLHVCLVQATDIFYML